MIRVDIINCPYCGFNEKGDNLNMLDYHVDNNGVFHWECFECNYKWVGDFTGKELKKDGTEVKT